MGRGNPDNNLESSCIIFEYPFSAGILVRQVNIPIERKPKKRES
jgi:hypothetical protein